MPTKTTDDTVTETAEQPKKPGRKPAKEKADKADKPKKLTTKQRLATPDVAPPAPETLDPTDASTRYALKRKVRIFYDLQRMRLQTEGRLSPKASGAEIQLTEFDLYRLKSRAQELHAAEQNALNDVLEHLRAIPFYRDVLTDKTVYRGIGPTLAGVLLAEIDWSRSETISQVWAFSGLKPIAAYRCKKCNGVVRSTDEHAVTFTHVGAHKCDAALPRIGVYESGTSQRPVKGEKLPYNAWLRTKLIGVLGPVLLKVGSPFRKFYDEYKHRWESAGKGRSDGHRHQAALRYMVKMTLVKVWEDFRTYYKLPMRPSYAEEYLGRKHHEKPVRPQASAADREADRQRMADAAIAAALAEAGE